MQTAPQLAPQMVPQTAPPPSGPVKLPPVANKLKATRIAGKLVNEYWDMVWRAKAEGKLICWYEGSAINPFLQAADICWVHGEAYSAMLAARHQEGPAQQAAEDRGYMKELCSYARTHLGCVIGHRLFDAGTEIAKTFDEFRNPRR